MWHSLIHEWCFRKDIYNMYTVWNVNTHTRAHTLMHTVTQSHMPQYTSILVDIYTHVHKYSNTRTCTHTFFSFSCKLLLSLERKNSINSLLLLLLYYYLDQEREKGWISGFYWRNTNKQTTGEAMAALVHFRQSLSIGRFSEAGLLEWMRFVIFHARSRERSQGTSGPISE